MAHDRYFPELFGFLTELKAHNDRQWFHANKARYERQVRDPVLRFIADLAPELRKIAPHFVVDPRPTGGSMMRIHRDIRFSKDKSPYKTGVSAHFWHAKGREGATPAYYLHLEPGGSMIGAGMWRPEPGALRKIRDAIVEDPSRWRRVTQGRTLGHGCSMAGESLKRPPPGYDPQHPHVEDLKRKDFAMSASLTDREVSRDDVMRAVVGHFRSTAPFVQFLSHAVGLP